MWAINNHPIWWLYLLVIQPNAGKLYDVEGQSGSVAEEEHQHDGYKNTGERDLLLLHGIIPVQLHWALFIGQNKQANLCQGLLQCIKPINQ